eukprot:m.27974 g.27974  ORF g.27974 m.27974 type:complete len:181 (+) comp30511_c0_seq1:273-815(+)
MSRSRESAQDSGGMKERVEAARKRATVREHRRMVQLNDAYDNLKKHLPFVPYEARVPKKTIVELAVSYIQQLELQLKEDTSEPADDVPLSLTTVTTSGQNPVIPAPWTPVSPDSVNDYEYGRCPQCQCRILENSLFQSTAFAAPFPPTELQFREEMWDAASQTVTSGAMGVVTATAPWLL